MADESIRVNAPPAAEWAAEQERAKIDDALRTHEELRKAVSELSKANEELGAAIAQLRREVKVFEELAEMACVDPVVGCECSGCEYARAKRTGGG